MGMDVSSDLRFALRNFSRNPLYTAIAVLTIALGIAVNTATFAYVDAAFFRPIDYRDPERLVVISLPGAVPLSSSLRSVKAWQQEPKALRT
jgi:hypothetical protein